MLILMYSVLCIEVVILYAWTILIVKKVLKYLNILLFKHFNKFKKEKKMQFKDLHRFI